MAKIWTRPLTTLLAIMLLAGCGGARVKAPSHADGSRVALHVHLDDGSRRRDVSPERARQMVTVGDWMEPDFNRILRRAGYVLSHKSGRRSFKPRRGSYLVEVRFLAYNPGNTAARVMVGFGAGAASLKVEYKLISSRGLLERRVFDVGSGRGWAAVCRKINILIARQLTATVRRDVTRRRGGSRRRGRARRR